MQALIYDKLANGIAGTTLLDDLSDRADLDIEFTHSALWGPLTARISWPGSFEEGFEYAQNRLGNPVEIWSPDGTWLWEGLIWGVTFNSGARSRTRSLEPYANRIIYNYTELTNGTDGVQAQLTVNDTDQQAIYGVIEREEQGGSLSAAEASAAANRVLSERTRLLWLPETSSGQDMIAIECMGWWRTLAYTSLLVSGNLVDIEAFIRYVLIYGGPFITQTFDQIEVTGMLVPNHADVMTTSDWIKFYLGLLDGWTFGLDQGRVPYLRESNRLSTTPTLFERLDGVIEDASGAEVAPWNVRPDTVMRQVDFVPPGFAAGVAIDSVENVYIVETRYTSQDNRVEPRMAIAGVRGEVEAS